MMRTRVIGSSELIISTAPEGGGLGIIKPRSRVIFHTTSNH